MNYRLKIIGSLLAACLLWTSGQAQEKDTLSIHFDLSRSQIRPADRAAIDSQLALFKSRALRPVSISLSGHCDNTGGNPYNDRLSRARTGATREYLRSKAIPDSLFSAMEGYGKRRPLNDNGDQEKRSRNRRVEIVVFAVPNSAVPPAAPAPSRPLATDAMPGSPLLSGLPSLTISEFFRDSAQVGKSFVMHNLLFWPSTHVLIDYYSATDLKDLLDIMLNNPGLKIQIRGHVCCIAENLDGLDLDTHTNDLSVRRARFVYDYLKKGGVKASRMSYHGFGASQKLYPEERNEEEQKLNRRVEIKMIGWNR